MRLWSVHPQYLDRLGLLALWREALLAQSVLNGKTKGYRHHPQLDRFRKATKDHLTLYLLGVYSESRSRGYKFDVCNVDVCSGMSVGLLPVTDGQMFFEFEHLQKKLYRRDKEKCIENENKTRCGQFIKPHPLFVVKEGSIEPWEKNTQSKETGITI